MAKLVTKFHYYKPNGRQKLGGYLKYIATREGVEKCDDSKRFAPVTSNQKNLIARLLRDYPDTDVIVHCDAGISRSAGIAAAILKHTTGDDSSIFVNGQYDPNLWCYRKTLEALS